jgi:hypothetical protein
MNDCRNCTWAKWQMTGGKKPRINSNQPGQCTYRVEPMPVLPAVLVESGVQNALQHAVIRGGRSIWSDSAFTNCAVWKKK